MVGRITWNSNMCGRITRHEVNQFSEVTESTIMSLSFSITSCCIPMQESVLKQDTKTLKM